MLAAIMPADHAGRAARPTPAPAPMNELRHTVRRLLSARTFAITAVLTIGVALGVNSMIFSAVRGLLVHPLPFRDAGQLVWIYSRDRAGEGALEKPNELEVNALARQMSTFESVAIIGDRSFVRRDGDRRMRWSGIWVTPGLFDVLGVRPELGRAFDETDARPGVRLMMLGYERWQRDFAGDPSIVGRQIRFIDNHEFTVVGILPRGLEFPFGRMPQSGNGSGFTIGVQDFWIVGQDSEVLPGGAAIARVRPDATVTGAGTEAMTVGTRLAAAEPASQANRVLELVSVRDQALGLVRPGLRLAQGFAAIMLLLACANLINLTLLRSSMREREFGVRAALGAGRRRIAATVVAEVVLVTAAGAAIGLGVAALAHLSLRMLGAGSVPMIEHVTVDWTVVAFTLGVATVVALVVAMLPAALVMRGNLHATLLSGGRTHTTDRRRARLRAGLVVSQVALALVLSVGAALIVESFRRLMSVDAGYDPSGVISADVSLYDHPQGHEFFRQLHTRLKAIPGVEAVGMIQSTPLTGKWTFADPFVVGGRPGDPNAGPRVSGSFVAFDYFEAMRTPVVLGRAFIPEEYMAADAPALIINETAARRFFPNQSPLGESVMLGGKPRRIVGVVKDMRDVRLDTPAEAQWFQPLLFDGTQLIIRTSGRATAMLSTLRRELAAVDSRFVINDIQPFDEIVATTVMERRMAVRLLAALATLALALASLGLYGVLSFNVARREREFGVRSALGAPRRSLLAMVLRDGVGMALAGSTAGVMLSLWLTDALRGLLFEVSPIEPRTIALITLVLIGVAAAASLVPAWRAASADPVRALRAD